MSDTSAVDKDFSSRLTTVIHANMGNEQFGVSELAGEMNMSRSNLLRKVKKETGLSVSQLISQARLARAMELLRTTGFNVSEVSHRVGFNSTSYFIKCFREHYGYPPGEVGKHAADGAEEKRDVTLPVDHVFVRPKQRQVLTWIALAIVLAIATVYLVFRPDTRARAGEKAIAVLPFKNDSSDSTNVYLMNGLMESTLNNLQKITNLRVVSRTSAEKYRSTAKSMPEVARELDVNYIIEGSGQKIGDQILLNIQLIDGTSDTHLWSRQYRRSTENIFQLQEEIAKDIAGEIKVIITPEVERLITKKPTENLEAYDHFLRGKDLFFKASGESMRESLPHFLKAIELDPTFALAYANATFVYYYLDLFQTQKKFGTEISNLADKAWLHDPTLGESLVAKALYYVHKGDYATAVPYLEKALEYNPDSGLVIDFLSEFYNVRMPNSGKYLEYALLAVQLDVGTPDSATSSFKHLHASNALLQNAFFDKAEEHIDKSLALNPNNPFAGYLKVYIQYGKSRDLASTKRGLLEVLKQDSNRIDVLQEVAKVAYYLRDYDESYRYYKRFIELREAYGLNVFAHEDITIAFVMRKTGHHAEAEKLAMSYKQFTEDNASRYQHLQWALYALYRNDIGKANEYLKLFSVQDNFMYWVLLLPEDPIAESIKHNDEFRKTMKVIENRFWENRRRLEARLDEKGLL